MTKARLKQQPAAQLYRFFWTSLDWIFPPECGGCGKSGYRWCSDCDNKARIITGSVCIKCGAPGKYSRLCKKCETIEPPYTALRSWAAYSGSVREALHRLKYKNDIGLAEVFSRHLLKLLNAQNWTVDFIFPVPLNTEKFRERGYNQSTLLARPISLSTGLPLKNRTLKRIINTRSQVGLSEAERFENVKSAFLYEGENLDQTNVLLVDDISTTGATISACAEALINAGAKAVYGLTVARTIKY